MAARAPASAALQARSMVLAADDNLAGAGDLEVTAEAEIVVTGHEHLGVHGAVRIVAGGAALSQRRVLKDKRPFLLRVTARARLVGRREIDPTALDGIALVRVVAIRA